MYLRNSSFSETETVFSPKLPYKINKKSCNYAHALQWRLVNVPLSWQTVLHLPTCVYQSDSVKITELIVCPRHVTRCNLDCLQLFFWTPSIILCFCTTLNSKNYKIKYLFICNLGSHRWQLIGKKCWNSAHSWKSILSKVEKCVFDLTVMVFSCILAQFALQ